MISQAFCQSMAAYGRWMNERLFVLCAAMPDEERKKDRQAFFRSIHGTLDHILFGDTAWLLRFKGQEQDVPTLGVEMFSDFTALRTERAKRDAEIAAWCDQVDERLAGIRVSFHEQGGRQDPHEARVAAGNPHV